MDNTLILDEKTLKRIPPVFILIFILLLGIPAVALNYFGIEFSAVSPKIIGSGLLEKFIIESQVRGYFRQVLLQWSAFSLATITVLLAFTQYRLTNDKIALIIGLSILFSGAVEATHTLVVDGLSPYITNKENIDAMIWTVTNAGSGIILMVGLILLLKYENKKPFRALTFILLSILLILTAFASIYYAASILQQPTMLFRDSLVSRPYETIYLTIYLFIVFFIYPSAYKKYPTILTNCIFYMSVTQIVIAIYLMTLSSSPYDSAYNIAYFLKIVVYFIPFSCLIINYVFSYNSVLEAQNRLQISQEKLRYMASHDPLTELYNRREFENLLDRTIASSARNNCSFALFLIDIDNFKAINDTLGHIHGDSLLKTFAGHLSSLTRKEDILSRIGGDEFTIITTQLKSPTSARKLAERLVSGLNMPYPVNEKLLTGTVSIGISIYPLDGETTEDLLKNADIAMYSAKRSGKNNYQFYTEKLSADQHRESEIESHLREALKKDEFTLFYQPQYNLITKEIIGAEILLRWNNKKLGNVSPVEFIPVAENSHLIISIGNWVLHKACEQAQHWAKQYKRHLLFSINVSPMQFSHNNFYLNFKKTLETFNYPADYLSIEITETMLMEDSDEVSQGLKNIDELGVRISLDDFGMGYSSLSRLQSLPIDTLKIDKLFVADIHNEKDKVVIIDTIITLAQELGMGIIAEGIETQEQLNYLIMKKCTLGQGFLLNKPLSMAEFEKIAY